MKPKLPTPFSSTSMNAGLTRSRASESHSSASSIRQLPATLISPPCRSPDAVPVKRDAFRHQLLTVSGWLREIGQTRLQRTNPTAAAGPGDGPQEPPGAGQATRCAAVKALLTRGATPRSPRCAVPAPSCAAVKDHDAERLPPDATALLPGARARAERPAFPPPPAPATAR